jgi:trk system potassium uptake protein
MSDTASLAPRSRRVPSITVNMAGVAMAFVAVGIAVCAVVEMVDGGDDTTALLGSAALSGLSSVVLLRVSEVPARVGPSGVFSAVAWTWVAAATAGALPFLLTGTLTRFDDALFESVAGFTTTGMSVIDPVERAGAGLLFWRGVSQWFGGMGMIVLALAVLPLVGVGGFELLDAESPGPSQRLTPRISQTAKRLWVIYVGFTAATAAALVAAGLSIYDGVTHAMTALATGGLSPHEDSIAFFDSVAVELILIVAMLAGGVSFVLHARAARGDFGSYWRSAELRAFAWLVAGAAAAVTAFNVVDGMGALTAVRQSAFMVVSVASNTAFVTADFGVWPAGAQLLLLLLMATGAMAGSTSGGIKVLRVRVMVAVARRELQRARHPSAVLPVKMGREVVTDDIAGRIAGFVLCWFVIVVASGLVLSALGTDLVTSLTGAVAAITNVGVGLGDAGPTHDALVFSRPARGLLAGLMVAGRLEVFPVLLMFAAAGRVVGEQRRRS